MVVIDYERGNLRSVQKALEKVGAKVTVTRDPELIAKAEKIVLPGVGAFADCMENLKRFSLIDAVKEAILSGRPFLGICLGLQLLFTESEEFGITKGLDFVPGRVVRFPEKAKVPHIGWNKVKLWRECPLFEGLDDEEYFYFVHSYYVVPYDLSVIATTTVYEVEFTSAIYKENVFATQFHPEKSQKVGLKVLENFVKL